MTQNFFYGFQEVRKYFPSFIKYVFKNFPVAKIAVTITLAVVVVEYIALSVMIPLSKSGAQNADGVSSGISKFWGNAVDLLGWPDDPNTWLWVFLFFFFIRILLGFVQAASNTYVSKKIMSSLSAGIFSRVVADEPLSEIYRRSVGYYSSIGGDEANRIGQIFFNTMNALGGSIAALIGMAILFLLSKQAFYYTALFLAISGFMIAVSMRKIFSWSAQSTLLSREANTIFIETFNGVRSIRSMGGEEFVTDKYREHISKYGKTLFILDLYNNSVRVIPGFILIILGMVLLFPSAKLFGEISVIYLFSIFTIVIRILTFLGAVVSSVGKILIDIRSALDFDDVTHNQGYTIKKQELARQGISKIRCIEICNIFFSYQQNSQVLIDISGKFISGNSYALVGVSGSGKSTLSDIILGLLAPITGYIRINDLAYEDIDIKSIRRRVVLVEQQTRIFSTSIKENITFGLTSTEKEIQLAVDLSGLREFIDTLPRGLDTLLDYQGANLSGGQRQRIGLARALIRNPDVLILDEATSALDTQTRNIILMNLMKVFSNKILLFITHDMYIVNVVNEVWHIHNSNLRIKKNHSND